MKILHLINTFAVIAVLGFSVIAQEAFGDNLENADTLVGQVCTNGDCVPEILPCTDQGANPDMCLPDDPTCTNGDCFYYACDEFNKIAVCHNSKDICVSAEAWPAHYSHGDTFGGCHPPWSQPPWSV